MIPNGGSNTAIEVGLVNGADGKRDIELRSMVWGDGLGWYRQQTLTLDRNAVTALVQALGTVQARLRTPTSTAHARTITPVSRVTRRVEVPARADTASASTCGRLKTTCCRRYERKGKACKRCPVKAKREALHRIIS